MRSDVEMMNLVGRYLDGQATAEEVERLEARMLAEPPLRADFLACARVDAGLRRAAGGGLTVMGGGVKERALRRTLWQKIRAPMAAAAAAFVGAMLLMDAFDEKSGQVVARFTRLDQCRWTDPATEIALGDEITAGQRIALYAGMAEVVFDSGARLTLIGPAIVEPRSSNSGFLALGKVQLSAETASSKGFVLETPTSKFIDIGTAFSAGVSADGLSRLEVSEGIVDVMLDDPAAARRLHAGETLFVEPGEKKIITRIEAGDGTAAFRFPSIPPPSADDAADLKKALASIRVIRGQLGRDTGRLGGSVEALLDGAGQSKQDAPRESVYFSENDGAFVVDLGRVMPVRRIHSYSWHQHKAIAAHRERAQQCFTLYGWTGDTPPDFNLPPEEAGWTRIARVNTDESLHVEKRLDRPAQQACAISAESGDIGRFRYLLWEVRGGTFYGEIDVFTHP